MKLCAKKLFNGFQVSENPTVLDLGCGTGIATFVFFNAVEGRGNFYGIDLSDEMINVALANVERLGHHNVHFRKSDAEKLDFPKSSFDLVYSNQMFHWIMDKEKMLREVFRVLKPSGQVALAFQGYPSFMEIFEAFDRAKQLYPENSFFEKPKNLTLTETRELLKIAGFHVKKVFATHRVFYLNAGLFFQNCDLPTLPWEIDIMPEAFKKLQRDLATELLKIKPKNPLKTNICTIFAYAQKIE
jgi:SAM-dependent methyltransferase